MQDLNLALEAKSKAVDDAVAQKKQLLDELQKLKDQNSHLQTSLSQTEKDKEEAVKTSQG